MAKKTKSSGSEDPTVKVSHDDPTVKVELDPLEAAASLDEGAEEAVEAEAPRSSRLIRRDDPKVSEGPASALGRAVVARKITISWGQQMLNLRPGKVIDEVVYGPGAIEKMRNAGVAFEES